MIERFMDLERPYGGPVYSKLAAESTQLKELLCKKLDGEGRRWLEKLTDTYVSQENGALRDAFADGFWSAVDLMLEYRQSGHNER